MNLFTLAVVYFFPLIVAFFVIINLYSIFAITNSPSAIVRYSIFVKFIFLPILPYYSSRFLSNMLRGSVFCAVITYSFSPHPRHRGSHSFSMYLMRLLCKSWILLVIYGNLKSILFSYWNLLLFSLQIW